MPPQRSAADSALSRREFLERTALAAGAAGVAGVSADTLLAEAAASAHKWSGLPQPRNVPIDHFVLLMMENRSFDHYFGWLDGHADATQRQRYRNPEGQLVKTRSASTLGTGGIQFKGCGHPDPGHGWNSGRAQLLGGFLAEGSENDEFALTYYDRRDLGFLPEAAQQYTLYDRYFCSVLAGTWPNRYYKWSAQSGGVKNNRIAEGGNNWETIFDRATARGLSVRYYYSDLPFGALWGARAAPWLAPISRYYEDAAAGKLPNIAIVDPPFKDGSGGDGLSADEHPLGDIRLGQAFQADVAGAFVKSPNYKRGAMFVMYDESGRVLRPRPRPHARPMTAPAQTSTRTSARWASESLRSRCRPTRETCQASIAQTLFAIYPQALAGGPWPVRARVDPQLHQLPVRPGVPEHSPPAGAQHRAQLQLGPRRPRGAAAARPARDRHATMRAGRRRRGGLAAGPREQPWQAGGPSGASRSAGVRR